MNIGSLKIDQEKLQSLCDGSCYTTEEFIAIRSSYDERVTIIIGKTSSILGFKGITFRLPYVLVDDMPTISGVDPENYDWQNLARTDLKFLKDLGILEISSEDVEKIASLATNGKNILFCKSRWQALESNCFCEFNEIGEKITCVRCGAKAFKVEVPEKLLEFREAKIQLPHYLVIFLVLIILFVKKLNLVH